MSPSIPAPPNLKDPKYAGAVDLGDVKAKADREQAEKTAREEKAIQNAVAAWHKSMNRMFKGISGGSSLHRRFRLRAEYKRMLREAEEDA